MAKKWKPKSKTFGALFKLSLEHHDACGCGLCCAVSGWDSSDDAAALKNEKAADPVLAAGALSKKELGPANQEVFQALKDNPFVTEALPQKETEPQTIFKYLLQFNHEVNQTNLLLPVGAKVLCFDYQRGEPYLWVQHVQNPGRPSVTKETRTFQIVGTGWEFPQPKQYIGTVQQDGYVWHCYEV